MGEIARLAWPIAAVAALVAANALFVAAEFAIVSSPPVAIRRRAREGSRAARLVEWVQSDGFRQDRFIATSQLGITATTLGLGMVGESVLAEEIAAIVGRSDLLGGLVSHGVATAVAIAGLTFVHVVCGEMMPKSIALQKPQETALVVGPVMRVVQLALYPVVLFTNAISNVILRLIGIDRGERGHEHLHTAEDLDWIVRESQESGALPEQPAEVLRELLDFGEREAAEVMVPRVQV
ncbi:MAG: CNNM domain-containing protein, partial [Alphaproteobacteria bacterium]